MFYYHYFENQHKHHIYLSPSNLMPKYFYKHPFQKCLISLGLFCVFIAPTGAEENAAAKSGSALKEYWLDKAEWELLPTPKPPLSLQCGGIFFDPMRADTSISKLEDIDTKGKQVVSADKANYETNGTSVFQGNVTVTQAEQTITSDYMEFDQATQILQIEKGVRLKQTGLVIASEKAQYDTENKIAKMSEAEFLFIDSNLNGTAEEINIKKGYATINRSEISSCPPDEKHWLLKSKHLELDQEKGWGYAKHASLHVERIPILYAPYFTFPLDDRRKTGFLYPTVSTDSINGVETSVPYYINIAPNYDATITPTNMAQRGLLLSAEFRYLNKFGEGTFSGDYLGDDEISPLYEERKHGQWTHFTQYNDTTSGNIDYQYISDGDYFNDIEDNTSVNSLSYLERQANLNYLNNSFYTSVLLSDFQLMETISEPSKPYRILPQINSGWNIPFYTSGIDVDLIAQYTVFQRDISASYIDSFTSAADITNLNTQISQGLLVTGNRGVFKPEIKRDFERAWGFLYPKASLHYTHYDLKNLNNNNDDKENEERTVPIYTLDSGLIFERPVEIFSRDFTQTLEPRIFLVKIPYKDQHQLPNFDSAALPFSTSQLYRVNRFAGEDRIGDTEQATIGLSSRFYGSNNKEYFVINLGQIIYFEDRLLSSATQSTTDPNTPITSEVSPAIADISMFLNERWRLNNTSQWDSVNNVIEQITAAINYKKDSYHLANLEYRYRPGVGDDRQEETRASFFWNILPRWSAVSYWNYDLNGKSTIELAGGIEYENCCIIVRALNQKWLKSDSSSTEEYVSANKQTLELQLKGLGSINDHITNYLGERVTGYGN